MLTEQIAPDLVVGIAVACMAIYGGVRLCVTPIRHSCRS